MRIFVGVLLLFCSLSVQAGIIYRCAKNGEVTLQQTSECPGGHLTQIIVPNSQPNRKNQDPTKGAKQFLQQRDQAKQQEKKRLIAQHKEARITEKQKDKASLEAVLRCDRYRREIARINYDFERARTNTKRKYLRELLQASQDRFSKLCSDSVG